MKTTIIILIVLMVLAVAVQIHYNSPKQEVQVTTSEVYQGPVPQGYDLEHFRQTGETIPIR